MPHKKRKRKSEFDILLTMMRSKRKRKQTIMFTLLKSGFYQTEKDWTEVKYVYEDTIRNLLKNNDYGKNTLVIIPGDGTTPQAGLMFALRHKSWDVISIDIRMKNVFRVNIPPNLKIYREKAETIITEEFIKNNNHYDVVVLINIHSHAPNSLLFDLLRKHNKQLYYVSLPCCVRDTITTKPYKKYKNERIISPKNEIAIFKFP